MNRQWCNYCKNEIKENENFAVINGRCYHLSCAKQMNTYNDPFDDYEDIYPEDIIDDEYGDL